MKDDSAPLSAEFHLNILKLSQDDSCLAWLKQRYTHPDARQQLQEWQPKTNSTNSNGSADLFLINLENDVAACATHRWAHFSQQSPLYGASPQFPHSRKSLDTELRIEANPAGDKPVKYNVTLQDPNLVATEKECHALMQVEPSRHIFTEALRKRNHQMITEKIEAAGGHKENSLLRPFFGGYISSPVGAGPTRFLLFPQWMHDTTLGGDRVQEVPYFLRGSITRNNMDSMKCSRERRRGKWNSLQQLLCEIVFNASFSRKFSIATPRWRFFQDVDAIRSDLYFNNMNSEQSVSCNRNNTATTTGITENRESTNIDKAGNIISVGFRNAGVRTSLFSRDPRHSILLDSAYRISSPLSNSPTSQQAVASLVVTKGFDSAVQRFTTHLFRRFFPDGKYHLQWSAGPGVEYASDDTPWTVFAKLATEWWVDLPIHNRLLLRIRNQSALVQPFPKSSRTTSPIRVPDESDENTVQGAEPADESGVAYSGYAATHGLFWATQGPRWDSNLVRGFRDDYPSIHYASRWYTLVSTELAISRNKQNRKNTPESWNMPSGLLYANACLTDSFSRPPRASVGFSFTGAPRRTIDAFNALTHTTFECSFNWWLQFRQGQPSLVSGFSTRERMEDSILRLSPSETFKHLRCGLTWRI